MKAKPAPNILYDGAQISIELVARLLCEDMRRIKLIDPSDPVYPQLMERILTTTAKEMLEEAALRHSRYTGVEVWPPNQTTNPFFLDLEQAPTSKHKDLLQAWTLFFKQMPPHLLETKKYELVRISPMAIKYIDTAPTFTGPSVCNWYETAVRSHPNALAFIDEKDRSPGVRMAALEGLGDTIQYISDPTEEEQYTAICNLTDLRLLKYITNDNVIAAFLQKHLFHITTNSLQALFEQLTQIHPNKIVSACCNAVHPLLHHSVYSPDDFITAMAQAGHKAAAEQVRSTYQIMLETDARIRELDVPRKELQPGRRYRALRGADLLSAKLDDSWAVSLMSGPNSKDFFQNMKTLSVWVESETGGCYKTVFPNNNLVPGPLGERGVTGEALYAAYYHDDAKISPEQLLLSLRYGTDEFENELFPRVSHMTLFTGHANIIDDVVYQANLPPKLAEKKINAIREKMLTELAHEPLRYGAEPAPGTYAAIYRTSDTPSLLHDIALHEYQVEAVLPLPGTTGRTYITYHIWGTTKVDSLLLKGLTEGISDDWRHTIWSHLLSSSLLAACVPVTRDLFGSPITCCRKPKEHASFVTERTSAMQKVSFHPSKMEDERLFAPNDFVISATISKHTAFYNTRPSMGRDTPDGYRGILLRHQQAFAMDALFTIAWQVTGVCGSDTEEKTLLFDTAKHYWSILSFDKAA